MKYSIARDKKKRIEFLYLEKKRKLLKLLIKNKFLLNKIRFTAKNLEMQKKGYCSIIKNYCIFSGRARSVIRVYNISRMFFKKLASFGYLKGIKKASW